jgi:hypothetical protein
MLKRILAAVAACMGWGVPSMGQSSSPTSKTSALSPTVLRAVNGRPEENLGKALELAGGVERIVGPDDVVLIKPNVQWWNQGAPNLAVVNALVGLVMERPGGFRGEVVLAENCHRGPRPWESTSSGWSQPFVRNSDLAGVGSYNELAALLKKRYGERFSVCHWIDVDCGAKRAYAPADGPGYVYCDGKGGVPRIAFDNGAKGVKFRETIMTYPICRTDRGTMVDLKNGVWEQGGYSGRPLRFINLAALNHHSTYCGMTSLIKNYLGVSDLSGGPDPIDGGKLDEAHYNFHSFPFNKWAPGPASGMLGAEIGVFLSSVRRADLNIVTAEWVGLASRTDLPAARTRAVLASTDPVALDYHAAKYLLHPNSGIRFHNPEDPNSPTHDYLRACSRNGGGVFDESRVAVKSFDLSAGRFQREDEMMIMGDREWGSDIKAIGKYLLMRYGSFLL